MEITIFPTPPIPYQTPHTKFQTHRIPFQIVRPSVIRESLDVRQMPDADMPLYFMYHFSDVIHNPYVLHKLEIRVIKTSISRLFVCLELETFVLAHHLELSLR